MPQRLLVGFLALLVLVPVSAGAHKPSDSYLTVQVNGESVSGRWDIALRDLEFAVGLDADGDGAITWGEVRARHDATTAYALSRLTIRAGATPCGLTPRDPLIERHSDGAYAVLLFDADCAPGPTLSLAYDLLFDLDPQHRGLARIEHDGAVHTAIFSPAQATLDLDLAKVDGRRQFAQYLWQGMWHIWIGFDHILFLVTLLLPTVLRRGDDGWSPVGGFGEALLSVAKIVTAFTVAHSLTLDLAALELVQLPSRVVESAIAASVVIAALNNVYPLVTRRIWLVAFAFGLVHGFGFAGVLADLGLAGGTLAGALLGFNLGVEAGQMAIVIGVLPAAFLLRSKSVYPRLALPLGSAAVAAVAGLWFAERAFDLTLSLG